jgi:NO-binding membrane sensor protein with MHYT domain/nitrogen-specific signal transduction histidine kinase/ActR/RegA family two-component response regulator
LFAKPPAFPVDLASGIQGFFIWPAEIPAYAEQGAYSPSLVILSYVIVTIASYVALDIAGRLPNSPTRSRRIKLICGALAMGAGIWAMHFVGMLSYQMRMLVTYDPWITALSMLIAIIFAGAAFAAIQGGSLGNRHIIIAAPLLGFAVCGMHYVGMQAMQMDAKLLYRPDLFFLSFLIAVTASAAALKLMLHAPQSKYPEFEKTTAAMVMGVAVCGMHYTGMMASVMLPYADCRYSEDQDFSGLAAAVSLITLLIIFIAFLVKQLDEALIETQQRTAQLFQSQKMEAVGKLTGGIAHDFNNMLGVVIGSFDLLSRLPNMPERSALFISTGVESARKASELIQRLLAFSRKQVLKPIPTDLNVLLPSALILAEPAVGHEVKIETKIPAGLPAVLIDPVHLESAILNLAINARDAMPKGGKLLISAKLEHISQIRTHELQIVQGDYVALSVTDTGTGMTEEVKQKAMEPFFTTKAVGKGSGLGLSMVVGFALQSGGAIDLESEVGKGTTITIYLPITSKAPLVTPKKMAQAKAYAGNKRILVVDDQKDLRNYLGLALVELGYKSESAASPKEALILLNESPYELLITDILMPEINGYVLAEKARQMHPGLKILFISGYTDQKTMPDSFTPDCCMFLAKPFSLDALTLALTKLLHDES